MRQSIMACRVSHNFVARYNTHCDRNILGRFLAFLGVDHHFFEQGLRKPGDSERWKSAKQRDKRILVWVAMRTAHRISIWRQESPLFQKMATIVPEQWAHSTRAARQKCAGGTWYSVPRASNFSTSNARTSCRARHSLPRTAETPWRRHVWARAVQAAIKNHNRDASAKRRISAHVTAYSFRHARISELLQIYGVDPLTVAAQTGTSIAMIEKAYLRFIPSAMHEKLAALKA
jgi:hypothetical protein